MKEAWNLDQRLVEDARKDMQRRKKEALSKKSEDLDKMVKKDVVDEKKLKRDFDYLLEIKFISKKEVRELKKMKPLEAQKITDRLVTAATELEQLEALTVATPKEGREIRSLKIETKLRWVNILKTAYLQQNQKWIDAKQMEKFRGEIGITTDRTEKWLSSNSQVKPLIEKMRKKGEFSKEEAEKYWNMNPIKALRKIEAMEAAREAVEEMEKIFGK